MTSISRSERILLIVSHLLTPGTEKKYRPLYSFIERSGIAVPRTILGPHYSSVSTLRGSAATVAGFATRLRSLASRSGIKAVDVLLQLHGGDGALYFAGAGRGGIAVAKVTEELLSRNIPDCLRLVYNTSCFGHSHSQALLKGGFKVSVGSKAVNANAATEMPTFCTLWATGLSVKQTFRAADTSAARKVQDAAARKKDFDNVNSEKVISGDGNLTIRRPTPLNPRQAVGQAARKVRKKAKKVAGKTKKTAKKAAGRARSTAKKARRTVRTKAKKAASRTKKTAKKTASRARSTAKKAKRTVRKKAKAVSQRTRKAGSRVKKTAKRAKKTAGRAKKSVRKAASRVRRALRR